MLQGACNFPRASVVRQPAGAILGISAGRVYSRVKEIGGAAGLPWLHPHSFRHTFATSWLLKGGSPFHLQTVGGWENQTMIRKVYGRAALEQAALDEARRLEGP